MASNEKKSMENIDLSAPLICQIKAFGGAAVTVVCLVLAFRVYLKLLTIPGDVYEISDNWNTMPILQVVVPSSFNEECPAGFEAIWLGNSDFTGIEKGPCGCVPNNNSYVSSAAECSRDAEFTNYCMSAPARGPVRAKTWRGSNICIRRGGAPATRYAKYHGFRHRPYPNKEGNCPKGKKRCGHGLTHDEGAICFPVDDPCPITGLLVTLASDLPSANDGWVQAGTFPSGDYVLLERREHKGELPVVDLELQLTYDTTDNYLDGDSYNPENNKRGPCYKGSQQVFSENEVEISDTILWKFMVNYPSICDRIDERYELFDKNNLQQHFLNILATSIDECAGLPFYALDDPKYVASEDPDYLNSGVKCEDNANLTCSREIMQETDCAIDDDICHQVVFQNVCGQYAQAARALANESNTFGMYGRSEIMWKQHCFPNRGQIDTDRHPLLLAKELQLTALILACIFGISCFIILPGCGFSIGSGRVFERRMHPEIEKGLLWTNPITIGVCFIVQSVATSHIRKIIFLFHLAGDRNCSDPFTNNIIDSFRGTVLAAYNSAVAIVMLQVALFLVAFVSLFPCPCSPTAVVPMKDADLVGSTHHANRELDQQGRVDMRAKPSPGSGGCCSRCKCCSCCCGSGSKNQKYQQVVEMSSTPAGLPLAQSAIHPVPVRVDPIPSTFGGTPVGTPTVHGTAPQLSTATSAWASYGGQPPGVTPASHVPSTPTNASVSAAPQQIANAVRPAPIMVPSSPHQSVVPAQYPSLQPSHAEVPPSNAAATPTAQQPITSAMPMLYSPAVMQQVSYASVPQQTGSTEAPGHCPALVVQQREFTTARAPYTTPALQQATNTAVPTQYAAPVPLQSTSSAAVSTPYPTAAVQQTNNATAPTQSTAPALQQISSTAAPAQYTFAPAVQQNGLAAASTSSVGLAPQQVNYFGASTPNAATTQYTAAGANRGSFATAPPPYSALAAQQTSYVANTPWAAQPMVQTAALPQSEMVAVVIPFGAPPGSTVQCTTPSGQVVQIVVPFGAVEGSTVQVRIRH